MMLLETQYPERSATVGSQPLSETEAAARLGLKVPTLRAWRAQGRGPAYIRLGRAIRYLPTDIDDFLQSNRHQPRSDASIRSIE
jgi:predicted DNA-binding transcriptional regulator AlpA